MNKFRLLVVLVIFGFSAPAQDCSNYFYMTNNAQVQMTMYDKKEQESGVQTWTISDVKKEGAAFTSTVNTVFVNDKGKEARNSTGIYQCTNGVLKADVRMSLPQEQMQAYKTTDAKMDAGFIEYPSAMAAGQSLKDVNFEMDVSNGGMKSNVTFKQTERKVEGLEKITTPAGTWDAYKITNNGLFRMQMAGIGIPMNMQVTEWFVPGFGVVKTESYSKNGKLMGSSLLTSLKK